MRRLTWRDGVAGVFAVMAGIVVIAVIEAWGWPLLGSYRAGVIALLALGVPMCMIGGYAFWDSPAFRQPRLILRDPFLVVASLLGVAAFGLVIAGLALGTEGAFLGLAAVMGALWISATARHAVEAPPSVAHAKTA